MEIWFLRHGETAWNREKRIQGSTSHTSLTEFGVRLAELTRDGMIAAGVRFDRILTSPYLRAVQTARIIADGFGMTPETDDDLRELAFGEYEGTVYGKGRYVDANVEALFENPPAYAARAGAESFESLCARAERFIRGSLRYGCGGSDRILAVSHGAFMRSVVKVSTGAALSDFWRGPQPNCCVHIVKAAADGAISLVERGRTFYPGELLKKTLSV